MNKYLAEFLGTCLLVLFGCGSIVLGGTHFGLAGIALSFGFTLMILVYWLGPISGCHLNPAVTITLAALKKFHLGDVVPYVIAQIIGATLGAYILLHIAGGHANFNVHMVSFACNGYGEHSPGGYSLISCLIAEVIMTTTLLLAVLSTTRKKYPSEVAGLVLGFALTAIILFSAPVTNASVNIARSIGVAVLHGGWAIHQLWLFAVAQLIAIVLSIVLFKVLEEK